MAVLIWPAILHARTRSTNRVPMGEQLAEENLLVAAPARRERFWAAAKKARSLGPCRNLMLDHI